MGGYFGSPCAHQDAILNVNFSFSWNGTQAMLPYRMTKPDYNFNSDIVVTIVVFYAFIIVAGLVSNLGVASAVILHRKLRSNRNIFVANLCISDILLCIVCMPFTAYMLTRRSWPLGEVLCKIVPFIQALTVFVSSSTVTAIAIDRHHNIVTPFRRVSANTVCAKINATEKNRAVTFLALIWLFSLLMASPVLFVQKVCLAGIVPGFQYPMCIEFWESETLRRVYTVAILLVQYIGPSLMLFIIHYRIRQHLQCYTIRCSDGHRLDRELKRNRSATLMLLSVTLVYTLFWLPWHALSIIFEFMTRSKVSLGISLSDIYLASAIAHLLAMSTSTTNAVMYGWLNTNIRRELLISKCSAERSQCSTVGMHSENNNSKNEPNV